MSDPQTESPAAKSPADKRETEYKPPEGAERHGTWPAPDGSSLPYLARAEWLVLREKEKPAAEIFSVAYLREGVKGRPLTFVFNGGPGAASVYLHVGALSPRRVAFATDGTPPPPPAHLADNAESWLAFTDLVFVDPVGTGFSRPVEEPEAAGKEEKKAEKKKGNDSPYFGLKRDLQSLGEFMSRYLSRYDRWDSPIFIAGESYGGFRVAKLARLLQEDYGVGLNGAILISPALEFALLDSSDYDILPWLDTFPTMAAAAAFHGKSGVFPKGAPLHRVLPEAETFATGELAAFLAQGAAMSRPLRDRTFERMAKFLGLPVERVVRSEGRIPITAFVRELLRTERLVCGRYDATITVRDPFPDRELFEGPDPTLFGIERVFAGGINKRIRSEIGVKTDREYHLLSREVNRAWKLDFERHALESQVGATDDLRYGMSLNPHMKVFITHGCYDLVTPYFSTNRIRNLMKLDEPSAQNLTVRHFGGGHMFYTWEASRIEFRDAIAAFYGAALPAPSGA